MAGQTQINGDGTAQTVWSKAFLAADWAQSDIMRVTIRHYYSRNAGADTTFNALFYVGAQSVSINGATAPNNVSQRTTQILWSECSADDLRGILRATTSNQGSTTDYINSDIVNGNANFGGNFTVKQTYAPTAGINYLVHWTVLIEKIKTGVA